MSVGNKVRIYDLAKELKQDTKRIMEELRREGADVSVPSNSVNKELAEKIRNKYFPKKETAPARAIKVIKKEKTVESPVEETPTIVETPAVEPIPQVVEKKEEKVITTATAPAVTAEKEKPKTIIKPIRLKQQPVVAEPVKEEVIVPPIEVVEELSIEVEAVAPVEVELEEETPEIVEPIVETPEVIEPQPKEVTPKAKVFSPTGTKVKILTLTKEALQAGLKQGERVVTEKPAVQKIERVQTEHGRDRDRGRRDVRKDDRGGKRPELRGTPGETATPQTVYTPPADARKKFGRSSGKKGADRKHDAKTGRFDEREINAPRHRSIEERILDQVGKVAPQELKPVRLVEGATVRDFAEKLGIVPKDIVQLLIKRGVFATLNQPIGEKIAAELGKNFGYDVSFVPFEEMVVEQEFEELIASDSDDVEASTCARCNCDGTR